MIPEELFRLDAPLHVGYRHQHDCPVNPGKDRCLIITRVPRGWKYYCHRCGAKGVRYTDGLSPDQFLKWQESVKRDVKENNAVAKVELPHKFTTDIPAHGLAWLYKYDLHDPEIAYYNIGYSPLLDRVITPVYRDGQLVYWQGRNLGKITDTNPKYMNVKAMGRKDIYFEVSDRDNPTDDVVLVEDVISTIRVGRHIDTFGLLYAYIPTTLIMYLFTQYDRVILWLDPDKLNRMVRQVNRFRSFGMNVVMIRADQDPKFYSDEEITEKLEV